MKKNILMFSSFSILLIFCIACKTEESKIREIAYNYSFAMANYQVDEAEPYATSETQSTTLQKARMIVKAIDKEYIKSDTPASIDITDVTIIDDTSALAVYHKVTPIKDFSDTLELRKRDGLWKAHAPIPIVYAPDPNAPTPAPTHTKDGKEIKEFPLKKR